MRGGQKSTIPIYVDKNLTQSKCHPFMKLYATINSQARNDVGLSFRNNAADAVRHWALNYYLKVTCHIADLQITFWNVLS